VKSETSSSGDFVLKGMFSALALAAIVGVPFFHNQGKLGKITYEQNLRLERKIDSLRFEDKLIYQKLRIDSIHGVRVERKVDSLKK
jgi:hypothetical protein